MSGWFDSAVTNSMGRYSIFGSTENSIDRCLGSGWSVWTDQHAQKTDGAENGKYVFVANNRWEFIGFRFRPISVVHENGLDFEEEEV